MGNIDWSKMVGPESMAAAEASRSVESRRAAYKAESDPIFIEAAFDNCPVKMAEWREAVIDIKARYPVDGARAASDLAPPSVLI